jgi:hypothetical protein
MRNRIFIGFGLIVCINVILGILLYKLTVDEFTVQNIILLIGISFIIYFVANGFLYFLTKIKAKSTLYLMLIAGICACFLGGIFYIFQVSDEPILLFPFMFIVPLFITFFNWIFYLRSKEKENKEN